MTVLLNLLPWRQLRRQKRRRYWRGGVTACLILAILPGIARFTSLAWQRERENLAGAYLAQLSEALAHKNQVARARASLQKLAEERQLQRLAVHAWEARLTRLAERLPASVWLSALSVSNERLVLKGNAGKPEDIETLEQNLRQLEEATGVTAGGIKRDKNGLLLFTFTIGLEVNNAV